MPSVGVVRRNENRKIRQEALREQLSNKGLIQKVLETVDKLEDPDIELDSTMVSRMSRATDARLRLISKYLPDLKAVEHTDNSITSLSSLLQQVAQMSREAERAKLPSEKPVSADNSALEQD